MAPEDVKGKKRKGATDSAPKSKKQKKLDETTAANKATAKALASAVNPIDDVKIPIKVSRKRAEEFWDEDVVENDTATKPKKGNKKAKVNDELNGGAEVPASKEKPQKSKKAKGKATADVAEPKAEVNEAPVVTDNSKKDKKTKDSVPKSEGKSKPTRGQKKALAAAREEGEEEDDQTAALLAGFESDEDDSDIEKEDETFDEKNFSETVPKELLKEVESVRKNESEPGVVYLGRIPHGFYEPQIKKYFSQFGRVTRYRVSRNKKTGASKHYAFIEFASAEVAEIVAKTMDKYLMFGHILQCRVIPTEQVPPNLWVGANKRFKVMPRNKIAGAEMARGVERAVWDKRVENENKRRGEQLKKLKEDYGYEFTPTALKTTNGIPTRILALEDSPSQQLLLEAASEEIPDTLVATEPKSKARNKGKKGNVHVASEKIEEEKSVAPTEKKSQKGKKTKAAAVVEEDVEDVVEAPAEEIAPKGRKGKKGANTDAAAETVATEKKRKAAPASVADVEPRKTRRSKVKA